jgi:multimeric flavodoxin WrbA
VKPDNSHGSLPLDQRPLRVLLIAGSNRRQYNCPGVDSKARTLMLRMAERLPDAWEIDLEDLGNVYGRARIQSCNACVSTSMALCCWPCNCYQKDDRDEPDLMWDLDLYARLDLADAWAIVGPINWYAPSSNLKLMFDRLVCMNGGNPREELIDHKDPEKAMALEKSPEWKALNQNHLEGRTAAFFCYGDQGANEMDPSGRPNILRHKAWFDPDDWPWSKDRDSYAPLVYQCRWSGIEVPDELWTVGHSGVGRPYADDQAEDMLEETDFLELFDAWVARFAAFVESKGKVPPGEYRAYGYRPPGHALADIRLKWRDLRMRAGHPRRDSSPAEQQRLGLNRDATWRPSRSTAKLDRARDERRDGESEGRRP